PALLVVEGLPADRRLREHEAEQDQDDDGSDVDEYLDPRHELRCQQQVGPADHGQGDHEVQGGVDDVPAGDEPDGPEAADHGEDEERELRAGHAARYPPAFFLAARTPAALARPSATRRSVPLASSSASTRSNVSWSGSTCSPAAAGRGGGAAAGVGSAEAAAGLGSGVGGPGSARGGAIW